MNNDKAIVNKNLTEAVEDVKKNSKSKFVGSIDIDISLNLKDRKDVVRGNINIPHSFGDEKKVIVFCDEKDTKAALATGAVRAGLETLIEEIEKGFTDFDVAVATPTAMPKIAKVARVLGPKGLMPNPKNGTVTTDIAKAVESFKSGRMNFKTAQDQGVIRMKVGKLDMDSEKIKENVIEVIKAVYTEAKKIAPSPIRKITLSPTMGAGVRVDLNDIMQYI